MATEGMRGELFSEGGFCAFAIPPAGIAGAVPFEVVRVWPAGPDFPEWADIDLAGRRVRIAPDICEPPFYRLADCLWFAHRCWGELPLSGGGSGGRGVVDMAQFRFPPAPHPEGEDFVMWRIPDKHGEILLIDRPERVKSYNRRA